MVRQNNDPNTHGVRRIHFQCPTCNKTITHEEGQVTRRSHKKPNSNELCNTVGISSTNPNVQRNAPEPEPVNLVVPNLDELILAQNGIANIVVINQENQVQEQIGNMPANGQINEPVHDAGIDIPMVLPHIYHNASDEQAIREWATRMHVKLEVLVEAESRNNRIEVSQALAAVFNTSHPNAKSGSLEPNLTVEEEDAPM